eukprot:NODE_209_length_12852_cov_0.583863.p7 type:complete len:104 gc:universal NODE_209_length_12852_cov_0.583863:4959-4648(-)
MAICGVQVLLKEHTLHEITQNNSLFEAFRKFSEYCLNKFGGIAVGFDDLFWNGKSHFYSRMKQKQVHSICLHAQFVEKSHTNILPSQFKFIISTNGAYVFNWH